MLDKEIEELDKVLLELEKYNYPYIQEKVIRVREIVQPLIIKKREQSFKAKRRLKYSWSNFDPNSRIQTMVNDLKSVSKYHKEALEELKTYDNETQDILHALEFLDNSDEEMHKMSEQLSEIRKSRRKAKNFIELSSYLCEFSETNKGFIDKLDKVSVNTQSCFDKLERRKYTPRELTALAVAFEKVKEEVVG